MKIDKTLKLSKLFSGDFRTCTAGDMIDFLSQFSAEMPLVAAWEGVVTGISFDRVETNLRCGFPKDRCDVLMFGVDRQGELDDDDTPGDTQA